MLYQGAVECVKAKMQSIKDIVLKASTDKLLMTLINQWESHKVTMSMIRDTLLYMNRVYCKLNNKPDIYEMGLTLFRDEVVKSESVSSRLRNILLAMVLADRNKESIDRGMIKTCLSMLVEIQINGTQLYESEFENELLEATKVYYKAEAADRIAKLSIPDYLRHIEIRIRQEEARVDSYLDKSTRLKLRAVVQKELIVQHAQRIVEDAASGCVVMLRNSQIDDLKRLYHLFLREPARLEAVATCLGNCVKNTGRQIVQDPKNQADPQSFVQQVLDLRDKYHQIVTEAFSNDRNFAKVLKDAVESFINLDSRAAQYLSLYLDNMFRVTVKKQTNAETEARFNSMIFVFRYLQDKDIFADYYRQHLAARLLTNASLDLEQERRMIVKLKTECGHQFTSRLEGMFKDMDLSQQLMRGYKSYVLSQGLESKNDMDFSVSVLTAGFWPIPSVPACTLPVAAQTECDRFATFYTRQHQGRRLTWQTAQGTSIVRVKFTAEPKELMVHTYQMCILALYSKKLSYTFEEILTLTKIPEDECVRHLLSLAHPKVRIMKKSPNVKEVGRDHVFELNMGYVANISHVKVPLLSAKAVEGATGSTSGSSGTAGEGDGEIPAAVLAGRKVAVDAAVVRVMKSKKTLGHNELVEAVQKQLANRFKADPGFIKLRIEHLIDGDFLARDSTDRRLYTYLA